MASSRVQEIERAIRELNEQELSEFSVWFDAFAKPQPIDTRIRKDLAAGRLDMIVERALEDKKRPRTKPL